MSGWAILGSDWHCVPTDDAREHIPSPDCWCKPVASEEMNDHIHPTFWTHHSADGRENVKVMQ